MFDRGIAHGQTCGSSREKKPAAINQRRFGWSLAAGKVRAKPSRTTT